MRTIQVVFTAGLLSLASLAFSQTSANHPIFQAMSVNIAQGEKCIQMINGDHVKQFMASPALKAVLLIEPKQLQSSEQYKKLSDQERKALADLTETAKTCAVHTVGIRSVTEGLATAATALQSEKTAPEQMKKLMDTHELVSKTIQSMGRASPDLAHFMHVYGK